MKRKVIVIGGGTAGLIAAITLKRKLTDTSVTVIRSSALGHIMVGEGTFASTPRFFHDTLGISRSDFYEQVNPTWKLGIRFEWGPRAFFDFPFPFAVKLDNSILPSEHKPWGYYCLDQFPEVSASCRASYGDGSPAAIQAGEARFARGIGYHFQNAPLVEFLERHFKGLGGALLDAQVVSATLSERGIDSVTVSSGESHAADFFVDASGFGGQLIHKQLGEPYVSMRDALFCDRAIVGGWERQDDEPIKPYTTAETMNAGWCWQIEHERIVNRGYVHSSAHLSADEAAGEYMRRNPRAREESLRIVPFETRHIRRAWVKNVIAIGNAAGFIEPLEATNIQVICDHALKLSSALALGDKLDAKTVEDFNAFTADQWHDIRDFLALHYRFNTRLDTPFWRMAVSETPLGRLEEYVAHYRAHGPSLMRGELSMFGHDGCLALLLGMKVSWQRCDV